MARTTDATQDTALAAFDRQTFVRVSYEDPDGTMQTIHDLLGADYFDSLEIESDADQPISRATFTFWRSSGATSLAPLIEASTINRDSGGNFASALLPVRQITVEVATMVPGSTPSESDYVLIWEGEIDSLDWAAEQIVVECLDPMTALNRHIIQTVATYGDDGGSKNIDDVMQDILDAEFGAGTWPITVVGTPTLPIAEYELGNVSVLAALMALADLIGWNLHWLWDDSAGGFRLTFYEPDRADTTSVYTFGPEDYYDVNRMGTGVRGVRNVGEVLYTDTSGAQQSVDDTRSTSVADFGESFIRVDAQESSIVNATQANNLLAAILDDTEEPKVEQEIEAAFHWPIELGDVHTYQANGVHYDTNQTWASFGYRHIIEPHRRRTIILATGKPSGGFRRWLSKDRSTSEDETPAIPFVQADWDRDAEDETATLTLTIRDQRGSVTAVEYSKREGSQSGDVFGALSGTWDSAPTPPPYDGTWSVTINVPPGEESAIKWKVSFNDRRGISRSIGSTHYTSQIDEHEAQIRVFFAGGVLMDNDSDNAPDDTQLQSGVVQPTTLQFAVWVRNELHLRHGAEVVALRGRVYNQDGPTGGVDDDSVVVFLQVKNNTGGSVVSYQKNSAAGGWQTIENLLLSHTIVDTESYFIDCTVNSQDDLTHARAMWGEVDVIRHTTREA